MSKYIAEPKYSGGRVKVELDFKNVDTSKFARKVDLANLKSDVDKVDIDKLKNVSSNLSNLKSKTDKLD